MDEASGHVARFLAAVSAMLWGNDLYGGENGLWTQLQQRGFRPHRPGLAVVASTPVSVALEVIVMVTAEKEMDFSVYVTPQADVWRIETLVYVDLYPEQEGQKLVRQFPDRYAATLDECIAQMAAAVADLATCADAVDEYRPAP